VPVVSIAFTVLITWLTMAGSPRTKHFQQREQGRQGRMSFQQQRHHCAAERGGG
jgi:hypothetical protein